jgi:hypothetical protein
VFKAIRHWVRPRTAGVPVGGPHTVWAAHTDPAGPQGQDRQSEVRNRNSEVQFSPNTPNGPPCDPNVASQGPKTHSISQRPQEFLRAVLTR